MQSVSAAANVGLVLGALAVQAACVCMFTHAHSVCFLVSPGVVLSQPGMEG